MNVNGIWLVRQADAARRLGVSKTRIRQMIFEGKLEYVDKDGFRYVTNDSLRRWEESKFGRLLASGKAVR